MKEIRFNEPKLGRDQQIVMSTLTRFHCWPGQWYYGTRSKTIRVLESLVNRGLVVKTGDGKRIEYRLAQPQSKQQEKRK